MNLLKKKAKFESSAKKKTTYFQSREGMQCSMGKAIDKVWKKLSDGNTNWQDVACF